MQVSNGKLGELDHIVQIKNHPWKQDFSSLGFILHLDFFCMTALIETFQQTLKATEHRCQMLLFTYLLVLNVTVKKNKKN